jgi:hypothetical protein
MVLITFQGCNYPKGSVVAVTIIHSCDILEPIDIFSKALFERIRIASEKKGDFKTVSPVFYNETNTFPSHTTHYIEIRLDTIFLLKIPQADKDNEAVNLIHDKYKRAKDKLIPTIYINGLAKNIYTDYDLIFSQLGLNKKSIPFVGAEARVIDIKTKEVIAQFTTHVESLSTIIIPANEQLSEMLTILRDKLQNKVVFY